jgi:hypothetical protein
MHIYIYIYIYQNRKLEIFSLFSVAAKAERNIEKAYSKCAQRIVCSNVIRNLIKDAFLFQWRENSVAYFPRSRYPRYISFPENRPTLGGVAS